MSLLETTAMILQTTPPFAGQVVLALISIVFGLLAFKYARLQSYQRLELASIELFHFEADKPEICLSLHQTTPIKFDELDSKPESQILKIELTAYITQILNLLEMAVEYRATHVLPKEIFVTWVEWIFETCCYATFQCNWESEFKEHYSERLREVIDKGIDLAPYNMEYDRDEARNGFYRYVAAKFRWCFRDDRLILNRCHAVRTPTLK